MPNRINHGTDMRGEIIDAVGTAALKVTPPVTVATAVASGFTLDKAVLVLTATALSEPLDPAPGLLPTPGHEQQARRLAEATAIATAWVKEALEPSKQSAETKPEVDDPMKAWMRAGRRQLRHTIRLRCLQKTASSPVVSQGLQSGGSRNEFNAGG